MEDSVAEDERYQIPPMNHSSEDGSKRDDDDADGKEEKKEGFVPTEKVKQEDLYDSGGGGGIINNLISNLITPLSPRNGKASTEHENRNGNGNEVFEREEGTAVENNGGEADKGVFSNLVSNFFHSTPSEGEEGVVLETEKKHNEVEVIIGDENKIKRQKTENGGGGIIREIVSHLPPSLPGKYNKNLIIFFFNGKINTTYTH